MKLLNDKIDVIGAAAEESDNSLVDNADTQDEKKFLQAQKAKKERKYEN
jgi:hypothetical protein